jgi:hypothetical protein
MEEEQDQKTKELEDRIKQLEFMMEKHKHSGKETYSIANILSENLGIKISSILGAAEGVSIDIMGVLVSNGRAAFGETKVYSLGGGSFGVQWQGGYDPTFAIDLTLVPVYANNAAAVAGGLETGQVYRTNGDPDTLCIVH